MSKDRLTSRTPLTEGEIADIRAARAQILLNKACLEKEKRDAELTREISLRQQAFATRAMISKIRDYPGIEFARIDPKTTSQIKETLERGGLIFLKDSDLAAQCGYWPLARGTINLYEVESGDNEVTGYMHPDTLFTRIMMRLSGRSPFTLAHLEEIVPIDRTGRSVTVKANLLMPRIEDNMDFTQKLASSIVSSIESIETRDPKYSIPLSDP